MSTGPANPELDISQASVLGNRLLQQLNELRSVDPLYFSAKHNAWIVSSHELVAEGYRGRLPLSSRQQEIVASFIPDPEERRRKIGYMFDIVSTWINFSDGVQHTRIRKLLVKAFSREMVEQYRPRVREFVLRTLDAVAGKAAVSSGIVDVLNDLALPVPLFTIMSLAGLRDEHQEIFANAAHIATETLGGYPTVDELVVANHAFELLYEPLLEVIRARRANPLADFVTALVQAEVDGERLSDFEIVGQLTLLVLAGHESTSSTIALSLAALSQDRAACEHIRQHPEQIVEASMELMRYVAMSTASGRIVAEDFEWQGRQLYKGQFVYLMIAGANRDPSVFPDAERIDLTRPQTHNMTFAPGLHHCIGHLIAKMEVSEFLLEFLRRYTQFELVDKEIAFNNSITFRGPKNMRMRLVQQSP